MRIGLLLGSFDPVHNWHLEMAQKALEANLVDQVFFVPAKQNPWKEKSTDYAKRCWMLLSEVKRIPNCKVSAIEDKLPPPYYSYKTLQALKEKYHNDDLYLIVGADTATSIKDWKEGDWILNNVQLITVSRPGNEDPGIVDIPLQVDISSTQIRNLVKENKAIDHLVPKSINGLINILNLYKDEKLSSNN